MEINGKTQDLGIANEINNFFADIGKLAEWIPDSLLNCDYSFHSNYNQFECSEVSIEEIKNSCTILVLTNLLVSMGFWYIQYIVYDHTLYNSEPKSQNT